MANFQKNKKYHFTYKTINLITGKYYLGMHSTNNLEDGYLGSGKRLWYEIRKYGKEYFRLEVLAYYSTREQLIEAEKELITVTDLNNQACLNLKLGGLGGFRPEDIAKGNIVGTKIFKEKLKDPDFKEKYSKICRERNLRLLATGHRNEKFKCNWKGRKHSEETKQKMSKVKKGKGTGNSNSQFNTMWITDGKENKKIKNTDIVPEKWYKGRTLVFN